MLADVFAIPVAGRWLVHSPLRRVSALVNASAVAALQRSAPNADGGAMSALRSALDPPPAPAPQPRQGRIRPQFLGIIPTRACNLACVYCAFGSGCADTQRLDPRAAAAAVDWMAGNAQRAGETRMEVHFFGGEPFVAGEVVDVVVHRARVQAAQRGLTPYFEVATNGVFDGTRARFVGDYFDAVVLSFDGPAEFQDRNRPRRDGSGSFEAVAATAQALSRGACDLCLRVCVTGESAGELANIKRWFCTTFRPTVVTFETLQPPHGQASCLPHRAGQQPLEPPEPREFARNCVAALRVAAEHGVQGVYSAACADGPRLSFCPVGNDAVILAPDGRLSACYLQAEEWRARGLDLDFGRLTPERGVELDEAALARVRCVPAERPRCERCFCRWTCAGGCHVNHSYPGCARTYDAFCIQTRLISACRLLEGLGAGAVADELLSDAGALEAVALRASDRLEDWAAREVGGGD